MAGGPCCLETESGTEEKLEEAGPWIQKEELDDVRMQDAGVGERRQKHDSAAAAVVVVAAVVADDVAAVVACSL